MEKADVVVELHIVQKALELACKALDVDDSGGCPRSECGEPVSACACIPMCFSGKYTDEQLREMERICETQLDGESHWRCLAEFFTNAARDDAK